MDASRKYIYIVVSQTGSWLSYLLKVITHSEYNHSSISFREDLDVMYSFGRRRAYNPFWGGFVTESPRFGTFKRFPKTRVSVLRVPISTDAFGQMGCYIDSMCEHPMDYGYNYVGLVLAALRIYYRPKMRYYCSEFVRDLLVEHKVDGADRLNRIVHPMQFFSLPECEVVYTGRLCDYRCTADVV